MYVCVCVCACMCVHVCVCVGLCLCMCVYVCMFLSVCVYVVKYDMIWQVGLYPVLYLCIYFVLPTFSFACKFAFQYTKKIILLYLHTLLTTLSIHTSVFC